MLGHDSCRWTRARLPLLAGGDLAGDDRRRVERHIITCASCRQHREALDASVNLLRLSGDSAREDASPAPSLWPALQQHLRESRRHPSRRWDRRRIRSTVRLALAASLVLSLGGLGLWAVHRHFEVVIRVQPRPRNSQVVQPRRHADSRARRLASYRQPDRESAPRRDSLFDPDQPEPQQPLARGPWPDPHAQSEPTH